MAKKGDLSLNVVVFDVNIDKSVIVNNAGYVLLDPLEHLSMKEIMAQFETKLFGAISDPGDVTHYER